MKYKVKSAQLHQPVDIRGFITKRTISQNDMPGVVLEFDALGLHATFKGSTVIIPAANVAGVSLEDDPSSK